MTPNAYSKGVDKTFDIATKGVQKGFNTIKGNSTAKNNIKNKTEPVKQYGAYTSKTAFDTGKKYKQTVGSTSKGGSKSSKA